MAPPHLAALARRHGFSPEAAEAAARALASGGGGMAQFDHPELGGYGQWSGGMTMIGRMGDDGLKARVADLFADLAGRAQAPSPEPERPEAPATSSSRADWWPGDLGRPSSTGAQNDSRYALFPEARRLAVSRGGRVTVYDTGDHRISGFGQQQGGTSTLAFTGPDGPVSLDTLPRVP